MPFAVGFIQGGEREREIKPEDLVGSFEIERERGIGPGDLVGSFLVH